MMRKLTLLLFGMITSVLFSYGQGNYMVSGNITDENGEPLIGANVVEKGTNHGTVTDVNGNYNLDLSDPDAVLVFSYVGYLKEEVPIEGKSELNITLIPDLMELESVVVVGYGTVKKSDLTGSVEVVESEDIKNVPVMSSEQVLQGRASGVFVAASNGSPGSQISVRIRGVGTPNNTDPLYVVDGMPIKDGTFGKNDNPSGINFLNPNDIESIQILKDASATAIYGTRGANGVIIITTKKGQSGKPQVNFTSYYGVQQLPKKLDLLDGPEFARLHNDMFGEVFNEDSIQFLPTTDWQDQIFVKAPTYNSQLSVSGGNENSNYYVSFNRYSQDGIVKNSHFKRNSFRINTEHKVNKKITIGQYLTLTNYDNQRQNEEGLFAGGVVGSNIAGALKADPTVPVYNDETTWSFLNRTTSVANPVGLNERKHYRYNSNRIQGSVFAEVELLKNLKYKLNAGLDRQWGYRKEVWPKYYVGPTDASDKTTLITEHESWYNYLIEHTLNYNASINDKHQLNLLLGYTVQEERRENEIGSSHLYTDDEDQYYHSARPSITDVVDLGGSPIEWALISYLGRINYTLMNKYLLTASIRRDGSSRFGKNNRYGNFPSFSLGWKINEESFMQNFEAVSLLKLRAGWGRVGNQNISPYAYTTTATFKPDAGLPGPNAFFGIPTRPFPALFMMGVANQDIGWETTETTNIGIDLSLYQNRFLATIDVYDKTTKDLLLSQPVPTYSAVTYGSYITNAGEINNKGLDLSLTYRGNLGALEYDVNGNFSTYKNKVIDLEGGVPLTSQTDFPVRMIEGKPIGAFYGYVYEGIFTSEEEISQHAVQERRTGVGDMKFKDLNLDGKIDTRDQTVIGYALPKFTYGFSVGLTYKNFNLDIFSQGIYGNSVANNVKRDALYNLQMTTNVSKDLLNYYGRVLEDGTVITDTDIPRIGKDVNDNGRISDYFLEDGSYFRIKTVTLAYNIPQRFLQIAKISSLRIYGTAQNLFTFSNYSGYNPEIGVSSGWNSNPLAFGIDNAVYPLPRTFLVGIDLSF